MGSEEKFALSANNLHSVENFWSCSTKGPKTAWAWAVPSFRCWRMNLWKEFGVSYWRRITSIIRGIVVPNTFEMYPKFKAGGGTPSSEDNTLYILALRDYWLMPPNIGKNSSGLNSTEKGIGKMRPKLSIILPHLSPPQNGSSTSRLSMMRIVCYKY